MRPLSQDRQIVVTWLGASVMPTMFGLMPFCIVGLSIFVAGGPPRNIVTDPMACFTGPMTKPEATPSRTPGWSPRLIGFVVRRLCAGMQVRKVVICVGIAIGASAMLG